MSLVNWALRAVLLTSLLVTALANAGEFTIHGPSEFIRHYGEPIKESFTFAAPVAGSDYILRIHNGLGDARRIRAARIKLNGELILEPHDFHKGLMDHYDFSDDTWSKEKKHKKWRQHKKQYTEWNLDEAIVIDKSIILQETNTIELVLYGIPQKKLGGWWARFLKRVHNYLPPILQNYINNGSGLTIEVVGVDDQAPSVVAKVAPQANAAGWHQQTAIVSFDCTDSLSGLASCSEPVTIDQDGALQAVIGTGVDNAGNSATTELTINLDTSAPIITHLQTPVANEHGWSKQAVTLSYSCSDTLSGIISAGEGVCPLNQQVTTQGKNQLVAASVSDLAGNVSINQALVNIDTSKPNIVITTVPLANATGWHKADLTASFVCDDALSGIVVCPVAQAVITEGIALPVTGQTTDYAGNQAEVTLLVNLDKTSPTISHIITPEANSAGWHNSSASISYACNDTLSGVALCPAPHQLLTEGAAQNIIATTVDVAGNHTESTVTIKLDKIAPTITQQFSAQANANGWYSSAVTLSYTCSDALSGIVAVDVGACPQARTVDTDGQEQTITTNVSDNAGNSASVSAQLNIDTTAPLLSFGFPTNGAQLDDPRPTIALNVADNLALDNTTLALTITDEQGDASVTCNFAGGAVSCNLTRDLVGQASLIATVSDLAGNSASSSISVVHNSNTDTDEDGVLDNVDLCPTTLPSVTVEADGCDETQRDTDKDGVIDIYDAFPQDSTETVDSDGDGIGDNSDPDIDGDGVANAIDLFPLDGAESTDLDADGIGDNSDPDRDGDGVLNESDAFPSDATRIELPIVTIDSPSTLTTVGHSPVTISGTVDASATALTVNGVPITMNNGAFVAEVAVEEGHNTIVARMVDGAGVVSTASINISLDLTPPYITIDSHLDEQVVYSDTVTVTGLLNDIVRGTIESQQASITVNGTVGEIANRSYRVVNVPLLKGDNRITVVATDQVGNTTLKLITLVYKELTGKKIERISGDAQSALINGELDEALIVKVLDDDGLPVVDKNVVFRVSQGSGVLAAGTDLEGRGFLAKTNEQGLAQTTFKLGRRSGVSNQKVRVRVVGYEDEIIFTASANANIGNKLSINSGNNQRGALHQPLPATFVVAVTDEGANTVQGARVKFEIVIGGGHFQNDAIEYTAVTDSDGRASAHLTLGGLEGLDKQLVLVTLLDATLVDGPEGEKITQLLTAGFNASGLEAGDPSETSISGVVLDNQDNPLPGVTVRVDGTTRQAVVDEEGRFTITEAPVGPVHLIVDGSTTTVEGEYPALSYNLVTVSGAKNPMAAPIYMVKLNTQSAVWAGKEDVVLTLAEVPGFKLEVPAGSVTFPDGSREGFVSVTVVNSSKVPMAPPNGMQPQFIVTIQPTGAMFDAPARLTLPNVDAHAQGAQVEMFSYDHDLEEFVAIGLGTVAEDGSVIRSNPGVGVIKAGWHCGGIPGGSCTTCNCSESECIDCADCGGRFLPKKKVKEQIFGDCKDRLCGRDLNNGRDLPKDHEGDCKKPACEEGIFRGTYYQDTNGENFLVPSSTIDEGDYPEDDPTDCVEPICVGPAEPDDSEIPEGDCLECKGGWAQQVTDHILKKEQKPDDCRLLYCDDDFDNVDESDALAKDALYNCKKSACVEGNPDVIEDEDDTKPEVDFYDCKVPACNELGYDFYAAQHKEDEKEECKITRYMCDADSFASIVDEDASEKIPDGTELVNDKCRICEDGEPTDKETIVISTGVSKSISYKGGLLSSLNAYLKKFGGSAGASASGTASVDVESCCKDNQSGKKWKGEIGVTGGVSADLKIYPGFGLPNPEFSAWIDTIDGRYGVSIETKLGIFLTGSISAKGAVTQTVNDCAEDCLEASIGASGSLGVMATGNVALCAAAGGPIYCGSAALEATGKATIDIAEYKYSSCTGGSGGLFCFKGITVGASGSVSISIDDVEYKEEVKIPEVSGILAGCE